MLCGLHGANEVMGGGLAPSPAGSGRYVELNREEDVGVLEHYIALPACFGLEFTFFFFFSSPLSTSLSFGQCGLNVCQALWMPGTDLRLEFAWSCC